MWNIMRYFLGTCRVRISGGDPEYALRRLAAARILMQEIRPAGALCIEARLLRRDAARAERICAQAMCTMEILETAGLGRTFRGLRRRWAFVLLLVLAALAGYFVPKFVFFYTVSGNERVPSARILRELAELGVGFGTYGPSIKPQELKNRMLLRIPELQWLTVTQNGMCAEVVVRERPEAEPVLDRRTPQNVVASRDGVVTEVLCYDGNCLVAPGQTVQAGQLLVSAYTDLEFKTQVTAARAEVYAQTLRRTETVLPDTALHRTGRRQSGRSVSLLLGKNRFSCGKSSGKMGADCDKITERRFFTLPGGYQLPIGLEITTFFAYDTQEAALDVPAAQEALEAFASDRIRAELIAGTAETLRYALTQADGLLRLETRAECVEMIARPEPVRILPAAQEKDESYD